MLPKTTENQITFPLLTGEAAVETAAHARVGIDASLRQAVRTALHMIEIGRVSEVRLDPRDHGIDFSFEDIDEQFCGNTPECPELVVTAVTGVSDDAELQFAALPDGEGDEMKSAPIRKSEIAGLSDLAVDGSATRACRGHLGLDPEPVTLVLWSDLDNHEVGGLLPLPFSESYAREFMGDLPYMDADVRDEYDLPSGSAVVRAYYTPASLSRLMDPREAVDAAAAIRAAERAAGETDPDEDPGVDGRP